MKRLLVTGGCGFIGSNYIHFLLETHADIFVVNFDKLTYAGNLENLTDLHDHPRYAFSRGDVSDPQSVENSIRQGIDEIVNFAAESHVDRSIQDSAPFIQTNVAGTQILLEAARRHSIHRFVQVSTDEVYGSLDDNGYFTEQTPLAPNSPYAASKAAGDLLVRSYVNTFQLPALITRCSNNYGPYQFPEKLIPLFIMNLLQDKPVPVYGDGLQVRDWIHVSDHCSAIDAVRCKGQAGAVYNIGGNCELTNLQLTEHLLRALDKPASLIRHVADRPGHDRRYAIDCSKIQRELDWKPRVSFEKGLADTVEWYQAHRSWIDRIRSGEYLDYYKRQYSERLPETV